MENKLTLRAIFLFAVCFTSSLSSGTSSPSANKTQPHSTSTSETLTVYRNDYVELDTTVRLKCSDTKITLNDMIYIIWKIQTRDKNCIIAVAKNDSDHETCHDGKKQNHTADGTNHLIIPNFSVQDEGNYTCDISYQSGGSIEIIRVSPWARPHLTGWLEYEGGHTVAVCEATGKTPVSISWETPWNSSSPITQTSESTGQLFTVISRFYLPQNAAYRNLTCVATTNDPKHTVSRFNNFTFTSRDVNRPIIFCFVLGSIIASLTGLYITRKKLIKIRKLCCKPKNHQPNDPDQHQIYSELKRGPSTYNTLFRTVQATHAEPEIYSHLRTGPFTYNTLFRNVQATHAEPEIYSHLRTGPSIYNNLFPTAETEIYVNTERPL